MCRVLTHYENYARALTFGQLGDELLFMSMQKLQFWLIQYIHSDRYCWSSLKLLKHNTTTTTTEENTQQSA